MTSPGAPAGKAKHSLISRAAAFLYALAAAGGRATGTPPGKSNLP